MARPVSYPPHIEPLVQFVEETAPEHIVARTHDKLAAGTSVKDMLLASALAVVRSSDLPPGHHGGPLHPVAGIHAVSSISARLPGEYAHLPVIQNVAVANKHIHSPAMGPYILADAQPVSEGDSVEATLDAFHQAVFRGVYNACDHYFLYLIQKLSPMQVLEQLLHVAIPKNQLDDHYFLFPVFTWRALEYLGWEYAKYIGRAPVRYITRPTAPAMLGDVDELIEKYRLLERDMRFATGEDETVAIAALADEIGRVNQFTEIPDRGAPSPTGSPGGCGRRPLRRRRRSSCARRRAIRWTCTSTPAPTRGAICCGSGAVAAQVTGAAGVAYQRGAWRSACSPRRSARAGPRDRAALPHAGPLLKEIEALIRSLPIRSGCRANLASGGRPMVKQDRAGPAVRQSGLAPSP
jgi:hypothetical protein